MAAAPNYYLLSRRFFSSTSIFLSARLLLERSSHGSCRLVESEVRTLALKGRRSSEPRGWRKTEDRETAVVGFVSNIMGVAVAAYRRRRHG
ncbi:hypothetical protein LINPERPRIM_LOCUS43183 [Linum perenne]